MRQALAPLLLTAACSGGSVPMSSGSPGGESVAVTRSCRVPPPAGPADIHLIRDTTYAEFSVDLRFRVSTCTTLACLRERLRPEP